MSILPRFLRLRRRPLAGWGLIGVITVMVIASLSSPAAAHNSLIDSDPTDGAVLESAPSAITWTFDRPAPLDSVTITLIDPTGVRTELAGSTHGPSGESVVVTPLPPLPAGEVMVRWRLVGPDGHPVSGRVRFTVVMGSVVTEPAVVDGSEPGADGSPDKMATSIVDDDEFSTPAGLRWILRYGSYLAIMAVVGILATTTLVWSGAASDRRLRGALSGGLIAVAVLAIVQMLVIASDIAGVPPWAALGSIDPALGTDAGMAFALRVVLALAMWVVLFRYDMVRPDVYWSAVSIPALGLLGTWAFAGHSSSMRWPLIGVVTDVAHHAAAATWIAGLAIVGWIVIPRAEPDTLVAVVRRFSTVAAASVAVLVGTGVVQSLRLVGNPLDLFAAAHGRYLVIKVMILAAMLGLANVNRQRVNRRLGDPTTVGRQVGPLRRAMLAEFAIGLVIVAVTAVMVVSPPAISESAGVGAAAATSTSGSLYYSV